MKGASQVGAVEFLSQASARTGTCGAGGSDRAASTGIGGVCAASSTRGAKPHFHNPLVLGSGCPPAHDWSGCTATSTGSSAANFAKCWTNAFRRCLKRVASDGQSGHQDLDFCDSWHVWAHCGSYGLGRSGIHCQVEG